MISFPFRERKAAQAAAYLLKLHGNEMYYLSLIKLLYLADRRALVERGLPITGDKMVSMDWGPVLSKIEDFLTIESEPGEEGTIWQRYVSAPTNYKVSGCRTSPETDELSEYEIGILDDINAEHGSRDRFELARWTHELPEWTDPQGSSAPIDPRKILQGEGKTDLEIAEIADEAEHLKFIRDTLASR